MNIEWDKSRAWSRDLFSTWTCSLTWLSHKSTPELKCALHSSQLHALCPVWTSIILFHCRPKCTIYYKINLMLALDSTWCTSETRLLFIYFSIWVMTKGVMSNNDFHLEGNESGKKDKERKWNWSYSLYKLHHIPLMSMRKHVSYIPPEYIYCCTTDTFWVCSILTISVSYHSYSFCAFQREI